MKTILTIVMGLFIAQTLTAQNDSLVIKLEDYGQIIVISGNLITEKFNDLNLDKDYSGFYSDFKKLDKKELENDSYTLKYKPSKYNYDARELLIIKTEREANKFYFVREKYALKKSYKYTLEILASRKLIIYLNSLADFEKLGMISLDSLYTQSIKNVQQQDLNKRQPYVFFYSSNNGQIDKEMKLLVHPGKAQDFIELYPSFGMQIINSKFVPEISFNMEFRFGKKGLDGQRFGLSSTHLFFPDETDFFNINNYNFFNAYYYIKFNNKWTHKVSLGYMYGKNGEHFSDNTWNAYWQTNINKIGVKLGGYYTKNLEGNYKLIPSIGFSFGF